MRGVGTSAASHTQSMPASLNMDVAGTALDGGFNLTRNQAGEVTQNALTNTVHQWRGYRNNLTDYSRNGLNQYTVAGPALSYDGNGDLIGDGTWSYSYNTDQQLTSASRSGLSATLAYDATGRLPTTVVAGMTTNLLYDGNRLVAETPVSGVRRYFVHGPGIDEAILQLDGDTPTYLHADYQGSIIATSNSAATVGTLYQYGPYGEPDLNTGGRMRYTGQQWLGGLGLYYYKARMYSPALGRFLQTDPIGYRDDMNLYAYVGNNPINRTDPTGLYWFRQFWQTDYVVGSVQSNLVRPGDPTSRFIENYVPAGRTLGVIHDDLVDRAVGLGIPFWLANIPTMVPTYAVAVGTEVLRMVGIIDQPTQPTKLK